MRKICFKYEYGLTEAVLDGRKTMTRRVAYTKPFERDMHTGFDENGHMVLLDGWMEVAKSAYGIGEEVAVAQRYQDIPMELLMKQRTDGNADRWPFEELVKQSKGYRNKMFVAACLMPNRIRIANIKVERLQDITDADALREGIYSHTVELDETPGVHPYTSYAYNAKKGNNIKRWWFETPRKAFEALIEKVCGKGTWKSNPWVFAYEFELET